MKSPFDYHVPTASQLERLAEQREAFKQLAAVLDQLPHSREKSLALTNLEQAAHWANKCVIHNLE